MSNLDTAANTLITSESFKDELTKLATGDDSKTKRWLKNIAIIAAAPAIGFGLGRYAMYPVTRALVSKTGRKFIRSHPKTSKALAYGLPAAAGGAAGLGTLYHGLQWAAHKQSMEPKKGKVNANPAR
ncbi:hypothetical protein LCGC14_0146810 [marine sediment metagenome]|uniref:Uncharacterized protein n=1 Tax=marine sediment metagenome TaxID=412755 RepID=A0A0F9V3J7_9ZZZZ